MTIRRVGGVSVKIILICQINAEKEEEVQNYIELLKLNKKRSVACDRDVGT